MLSVIPHIEREAIEEVIHALEVRDGVRWVIRLRSTEHYWNGDYFGTIVHAVPYASRGEAERVFNMGGVEVIRWQWQSP